MKSNYHVIFHLDSESEGVIKKTLNNLENVLHDPRLQGKIVAELIANSKGYHVYEKGNSLEEKLKKLQSEGVILAQCGNTLSELKIDREKLYPFISVVPSAMGEIVLRQSEGWAYVHPGQ